MTINAWINWVDWFRSVRSMCCERGFCFIVPRLEASACVRACSRVLLICSVARETERLAKMIDRRRRTTIHDDSRVTYDIQPRLTAGSALLSVIINYRAAPASN